MNRILLVMMLWAGCCLSGVAQTADDSASKRQTDRRSAKTAVDSATGETTTSQTSSGQPPADTTFELTNNLFIVLVIFMILVFSYLIIRGLLKPREGDPLESTELIRVVSMILIVTCALLVPVISGQIDTIPTVAAPLYSLLGTIAGYLLGKGSLAGSGSASSGNTTSTN